MGKPHPIELRARVVAFVEEGNSHREAARHFRVSPRFVNNMVILKRASGALAPARQGHLGGGKLTGHEEWVRSRLAENGDLTLNELCVALAGRGVLVDRSTVSRLLHRLGLSHKKSLQAAEQLRPQIARARDLWINRRKRFFNKALAQLIFIDETSTNTKLTKRTGWSPRGKRYRTHAPFGSWKTQTFIAGLRCHGLTAPWIVNRPMNGNIFETWVETQLAPTLSPGDVSAMLALSRDPRQCRLPQKPESRGNGKSQRCMASLPAALFAGPQSHRNGLFLTQGPVAKTRGTYL